MLCSKHAVFYAQEYRLPKGRAEYGPLVEQVRAVLRGWSKEWGGRKEWRSFLNRKSFLHEVEEALVPLRQLLLHIESTGDKEEGPGLNVVDLCSGKVCVLFFFLTEFQHISTRIPIIHR